MNEHLRPRIVKVGILRDGKMAAERVLKTGQKLSVGTDPSSTFQLTGEGAPKNLDVLVAGGDQFFLVVDPEIRGKVAIAQGLLDMERYADKISDSEDPADHFIKLDLKSKGKITIGDCTILFQVMATPPQPPIRTMPKDMKGGYINRMDVSFIIILVVSALLHLGMIHFVNALPVSETLDAAETNRFMSRVVDVKIEDIPPEEVIEDKPLEDEKEKEKKKDDKGKKPKAGGSGDGEAEEKGVETKGLLALITADSGSGSVANLINELGMDSGIKDIVGKIGSGINVAKAGDALTRKGDGGSGVSTVDAGDLGRTGSSNGVGTGKKKTHKVKAKVSSTGGVSGSLSATSVRGKIRRYVGGIRYCYESALKSDPTLSGKVSVSFSINGSGGVAGCSVSANTVGNGSVGSCVCRRINRWKFDPPEDGGSSSVNYTFIFTPAAN
jgi:TonB family protein